LHRRRFKLARQLKWYIFLVQGIGAIFYGVFSAAYILTLPSTRVLSGEPIFKVPLTIFSIMFVALILFSLAVGAAYRQKK
jgi:hypothetical protein